MNESINNIPFFSPFSSPITTVKSFENTKELPFYFKFIRRKTFDYQISLSELSQSAEKNQIIVIFPFFVINPLGKFKKFWNFIMLLTLLYLLFVYPMRLAFTTMSEDLQDGSIYLDFAMDTCFFVDIFLNFFTAFEDKQGKLIYRPMNIAMGYFFTWFFIDLLTAIPFYWLICVEEDLEIKTYLFYLIKGPQQLKFLSILRIFKFFRLYPHTRQIEQFLLKKLRINPQIYLILKFLSIITLTIHLSSCLWFFLCDLEGKSQLSWIYLNDLKISSFSFIDQYIASQYFIVTVLMSVGYGGTMVPVTNLEKSYFVISIFFAMGMFGYIMGMCITLFSQKPSIRARTFITIKQFLDDFTVKFRVSRILHWKMLFSSQKSCFFNNNILESYQEKLLNQLPLELHYEVLSYIYKDLLNSFEFFLDKPMSFITQLLPIMKPSYFSSGDEVYKQGDPANFIYFLQKGRAVTCCKDKNGVERANIYIKGTYFGEVDILLNQERLENCYAETELKLLRINKSQFLPLLSQYEAIQEEIVLLANKRAETRKTNRKAKFKALLPRSYWIWQKNKDCLECSIEDAHLSQRRSTIRQSILDGNMDFRNGLVKTRFSSKMNDFQKILQKKNTLNSILKFSNQGVEEDVEIEDGEIEEIAKEKFGGFLKEEIGICEERKEVLKVFEMMEERGKKKEGKKWDGEELERIYEVAVEANEILKNFLKGSDIY